MTRLDKRKSIINSPSYETTLTKSKRRSLDTRGYWTIEKKLGQTFLRNQRSTLLILMTLYFRKYFVRIVNNFGRRSRVKSAAINCTLTWQEFDGSPGAEFALLVNDPVYRYAYPNREKAVRLAR